MNTFTIYLQHHRNKLIAIPVLTFLAIAGFFSWHHYQDKQNDIAQSEMFQAVYHFEAGDYDKALQGDDAQAGFLNIISKYGFTKAANLARFYAGVSYLHQASYEEAIRHLSYFRSKDFLLQARAWSLIGDAFTEQKNYAQAIKYYLKAAKYQSNDIYSPIYWTKAAVAYEAQGDYKNACKCYRDLSKAHPTASLYIEALKQIDRLEGMMKAGAN